MTGARAALGAGLLYGVPLTLWLFTQAPPGPLPPDLSAAVPVFAGCQAVVLLLLVPAGACTPSAATAHPPARMGATISIALLVMVPWPVLALVLATGTVTLTGLSLSQGAVALWGLLLTGTHWLSRYLPPPLCPTVVGAIQGLGLLGLLTAFDRYRTLSAGALIHVPAGN